MPCCGRSPQGAHVFGTPRGRLLTPVTNAAEQLDFDAIADLTGVGVRSRSARLAAFQRMAVAYTPQKP